MPGTVVRTLSSQLALPLLTLLCYHPAALYTAIYRYVLGQSQTAELTVEDPAEAFEDLRDRNDLRMLLGLEQFVSEGFGEGVEGHSVSRGARGRHGKGKGRGKMGPPVEKGWMEKWRVQLKIAGVCRLPLFLPRKLGLNTSMVCRGNSAA